MFTRQSSSSNGKSYPLSLSQRGRASLDVPSSLPSSLSLPLLSLSPVNIMAANRQPSPQRTEESNQSSIHSSATLPSIRSISHRFLFGGSKNGKKQSQTVKVSSDSHKSIGDVFPQNYGDQSLDAGVVRQGESSLGLTGHEHGARMVSQPILRPSTKNKRRSYDISSLGRPSMSSKRSNTIATTVESDESVLDVRHQSPKSHQHTPLASPLPLPVPSLDTLPPPHSASTTSFSTSTTPPPPETPSSPIPASPTSSEDNPNSSLNITRVIDLSQPHISVSLSPPPQDKRVTALAKELNEVIKERGLESLLEALTEEQKSPTPTNGRRSMSVEPDSSYVVSSPERDIVTAGVIKGGREKRWTLQEMSSALEKLVESSTTKDNELEVKIEAAPSPAASLAPPSPHTGGSSPRPSSSGGQDLSFAASSHLEIDPQAIDEHLEKRFGEGWAERMILGDADERTAEETIKQEVQLKEKSPLDVHLDTPKVDVDGFDPELAKLLSPNVFTGGTTTPNEEDLDLKDLEAMAPTSTSTPVKETRGRVSMIFTAATPTSESKERFQDLDRISSSTPTAASSFVIRNRSRSNTPTPTESSSTAAPSLTSASTKTSITSSRKEPPPPLKIDLDLTISSPSPVRKLIPLDNATSAPGSPISSKRRSIQSVHSLQRAPFVFSPGDTTPLSAASAPNFAPNSNVHGMAALGVAGGRRPAGRSPLLESRTIHTDGEDIAPLRPQHTGGTARSVSLKLGKERDREMGNRRSLDVGNDGEKYNRPSTSTAQYTPRVGRSPQSFLNHAKREELMPPRSVTSLGRIRKDEIPPRSVTSLGSASPFKTRGSIDMGHTAPLPRVVTNVVGRNRRGYSVDEGNSPNQGNRDRSATVSSTSTANSGGGGMLGGMGPLTRRAFVAAGLLDVDREGSTSPVREREIWREMPTSAGTSGSGGSGGHVGLGGGGGTGSEFSVETGRTSVSGVPPGKPSFDDAQYLHASPLTPSGGQTRTLYGSTTPSKSTPTSTNIKHPHHYHHAHEEIQHSTTLRTLRERHEESIRQLRSQHDDNLRILRQQHEESTCELRTQHEEAIQVLKMENEEKVQLLQERHELEKDALLSALSENKRSLTRVKEENMRLEKYVKELEERLVGALDLNRRSVKAVIEGGGGASSPRMKQPTVPGRRVATMMGHTRTQSSTVTSSMNEDKELDNGSRMAARRLLNGRAPERAGVGKGHPSSLRPTTPTSRLTASVGAGVLRSAGLPVSDTAEDDSAKLAPWTKQPRHRRSVASESSIVLPTPSRMHSMLFDVQAPAATSELLFQDDGGESEFGLHSDTETEHLGAMAIHMTTTPPSPSSNTRPVSEIMAGRGASPNFSFSMRSASPGSLRLRPEDELHLADLGSLMDDRESLREVDDEDEYDEDGYYYDDDDLLHGGYTLRA